MAHTDYNVPGQTNLATVNTFFLGKPAPIVAERIWDTKAHAQEYIDDTVGSAFIGMRLSVINDGDNNGLYYVKGTVNSSTGAFERPYSLVKLKEGDYPFARCINAAGTVAKTAAIEGGEFQLKTGQRVTVYFTLRNTANSPTLNIESTGAKNIFRYNGSAWVQITTGSEKGDLDGYVDFIYDGTQYKMVDSYHHVEQFGINTGSSEEHSILLKHSDNTTTERHSVVFSGGTNKLATINTNTGKITTPGYILSDSGTAITTKKILVGDGTAVDAPSATDTYLKATISDGTTTLGWATVSGGGGGTVTSVIAGTGLSAVNSGGTALTNDEITTSGTINLDAAGNNTLGGIKLGYTNTGRNMALETSSDKAYVNVPITNTNTTYLAGSNITITDITTNDFTDWVASGFTDGPDYCDITITNVSTTPNPFSGIVRFKTNSIIKGIKRYCFLFGSTRASLIDWSNGNSTSMGSKYMWSNTYAFYPNTNYYFKLIGSGNTLFAEFLGTDIKTIAASGGGGSANDTTITLQGGASAASSTWSDSFTTNASTAKTIYVPVMTGASSSGDGDMGLVPKPLKNNNDYTKFLRGDGTWQSVSGGTTDSFKTIAVSGQSSVVADSSTDTLTLVAGTGMTITTNASTDTITFASSGGGGIEGMRAYSVIPANIIQPSPMEFVLRLFDPIVKDYASNDVTVFTDKMKASEGGGFDGHIPVGAMILFYAAYLNSKSLTSGRLVWDTPGMGDYFNYIICNGGSTLYESTDPSYGDEQALNDNTVTLFTFNWAAYGGNGLPDGINDWVSSYAGRSDTYNLNFTSKTVYDENYDPVNVVGASPTPNIGVTLLGGSANTYITHRYTFHISDIEPGDGIDSLTSIIAELRNGGAASAYAKLKNDDIFQSKTAFFKNIVVSLDHRSCVTGEGASIFYGKPS